VKGKLAGGRLSFFHQTEISTSSQGTKGSELRRPLGIAILGGLLVSQFLTLFTTPVLYLYLDRFSHWIGARRAHVRPSAGATAE